MLTGEVGAHNLRGGIGGPQVDVHALPGVVPFRVGEKARQRLGVQVTLAVEITVEAAAREAGVGHDLIDGYAFKAMAIEKPARAVNDLLLDFFSMTGRIRHAFLLGEHSADPIERLSRALQNMSLIIF